jgi:hypothetical protein
MALSSIGELKAEIARQARCPIDWPEALAGKNTDPELHYCLEQYWVDTGRRYAVRAEASLLDPLTLELETDTRELGFDLANMLTWIDQARERYLSRMSWLKRLRVATPDDGEYRKHYPRPYWSPDDVRRESKRGARISCLHHGVTVEDLEALLWAVMEVRWHEFAHRHIRKYFVDCQAIVGASLGMDTRYLCMEISRDAALAHHYPVPGDDFNCARRRQRILYSWGQQRRIWWE